MSLAYASRGCSYGSGGKVVSHNATQPPVCISLPEGKWDANEGLGEGRARTGGGEIKWEIGRGGMLSTAARRVPEGDQEKRKEDKKQGGSGRTSPAETSAPAETAASTKPNVPVGGERRGLRRGVVVEVAVTAGVRVLGTFGGAVAG